MVIMWIIIEMQTPHALSVTNFIFSNSVEMSLCLRFEHNTLCSSSKFFSLSFFLDRSWIIPFSFIISFVSTKMNEIYCYSVYLVSYASFYLFKKKRRNHQLYCEFFDVFFFRKFNKKFIISRQLFANFSTRWQKVTTLQTFPFDFCGQHIFLRLNLKWFFLEKTFNWLAFDFILLRNHMMTLIFANSHLKYHKLVLRVWNKHVFHCSICIYVCTVVCSKDINHCTKWVPQTCVRHHTRTCEPHFTCRNTFNTLHCAFSLSILFRY